MQNDRVVYVSELTSPAPYSIVGANIMLDMFAPRIYPDAFPEPLTDAQVREAGGN